MAQVSAGASVEQSASQSTFTLTSLMTVDLRLLHNITLADFEYMNG